MQYSGATYNFVSYYFTFKCYRFYSAPEYCICNIQAPLIILWAIISRLNITKFPEYCSWAIISRLNIIKFTRRLNIVMQYSGATLLLGAWILLMQFSGATDNFVSYYFTFKYITKFTRRLNISDAIFRRHSWFWVLLFHI